MTCDVTAVVTAVRAAATVISDRKTELTRLDQQIGDGDHGENLARGFTAVLTKLDTGTPDTPAAVLQLVGNTLIATVGGASGPLYGTAFLRAATALADTTTIDGPHLAAALTAARDGVIVRGKAEPGDKTMVDALTPAVQAATASVATGEDHASEVLTAAADAAAAGCAATIALQARKGRASYLGAASIGHQDPGATSVAYLLRAMADSVTHDH